MTERERTIDTGVPHDVEYTGTKWRVEHISRKIGDEFHLDDGTRILHVEEHAATDRLSIWILEPVSDSAFLPPEGDE